MCFNETASLFALSVGWTFAAILFSKNEVCYAGILFFISFIQLFEYFIHRSLRTKDDATNRVFTLLIFIFVALQPIVFSLLNMYYAPKGAKFILPSYLRSPWVLFAYLAVAVWVYSDLKDSMLTTAVDKCGTVCRLNWFKRSASYSPQFFFVAYLVYVSAYTISDGRLFLSWIIPVCLIISWVYIFLLDSEWSKNFSFVGSMWCFLAVFGGGFFLLKK